MRRVLVMTAAEYTCRTPCRSWNGWTQLVMVVVMMTQVHMVSLQATGCVESTFCSSSVGTFLSLDCSRSEFVLAIDGWSDIEAKEVKSLYIQCSAHDGTSCLQEIISHNSINDGGIFSEENQLTLDSTIGYDCVALGCYEELFTNRFQFVNSSCYLGPATTEVPTTEMATTPEATTEADTTTTEATTETTTEADTTSEPMATTTEATTDATATTRLGAMTSEQTDTISIISTEEPSDPTDETRDGNVTTTDPGTGTGPGVESAILSVVVAVLTPMGVVLASVVLFSCCVFLLTRHSLSRKPQRTHYTFGVEDLTYDPGLSGEEWLDISSALAKSPVTVSAVSVCAALHLQEKDYTRGGGDLPDPNNPNTPVGSARNALCDNEYIQDPISCSKKPAEPPTDERGVSWEPDAVINMIEDTNSAYVVSSGCGNSGYGSGSGTSGYGSGTSGSGCGTLGSGSTSATNSDLNNSFVLGDCVLEIEPTLGTAAAGFQSTCSEEDDAMDSPTSVYLDRDTWPKTYPTAVASSSPKLVGSTRFHPQREEEEDRKYVILDSPLSKGAELGSACTREDEGYRSPTNLHEADTDYLEVSLSYEDLKVAGSNGVGGANIVLDRSCYDNNYIYT